MFNIVSYFEKALAKNCLPHALLIIGDGGEEHAKQFAIQLLQTTRQRLETGNHPDFHFLQLEGKSTLHSIESIRTLIDQVYKAPFEALKKVFVIIHAERMQPAAANALLKTLEEPLLDTILILLTQDVRQMLATIRSRCVELVVPQNFSLSPIDFTHLSQEIEKIESIEDPLLQRQKGEEFLMVLMMWIRDAHARKLKVAEERLFFPKAPSPKQLPSLETWEKMLQKAHFALQRNMKLSTCCDSLITWV